MKKILLLLLTALCMKGAYAQAGDFTLSYPISLPMGNLHDYIGATSFRGISMEFNKRVKPNVAVGLEVGWNVFYERTEAKTYEQETASITGVTYRYTNSVPMIVGAKWYKGSESGKATPFAGLGLGVLYVNRATDFGLYRLTTDAWQFCIRPELGVNFQLQPGLAAYVGAKYYSAFNTDDLDGQPFLSFNVGLVFMK
jgi:outer membrane protein W